jgi:hypothetical protein
MFIEKQSTTAKKFILKIIWKKMKNDFFKWFVFIEKKSWASMIRLIQKTDMVNEQLH